jgi:RNA polymerase sigma factor (TIGR02999 family)
MAKQAERGVTETIKAVEAGDTQAAARLLPLVYTELRRLARARMAHRPPGQTLQPTELVHEAYLRLVGKAGLPLESQKHFFFAAARAMRDILVERARRKAGPNRGGGRQRVELTEALAIQEPPPEEVLAVQEAVRELESKDPVKGQIVNLRYYAGMTVKETAQVLGLSERTVHRHGRFIEAWLKGRLGPQAAAPAP